MDGTDILNKLRQIHTTKGEEGRWFGVNALEGGVADMY